MLLDSETAWQVSGVQCLALQSPRLVHLIQ